MKMIPFSDPQAGFSGLRPSGWVGQGLGFWLGPVDEPALYQRGIPNMTAAEVQAGLLPMFGFSKLPERSARRRLGSLQWDLYHLEATDLNGQVGRASIALAQQGKWAFVVLLAATPGAYEKLHTRLFLPALEAFTPYHTGPEAARVAKEKAREYAATVQQMRDIMKANLTVESDWVSDQMKGLPMPPARKEVDPAAVRIPLPTPEAAALSKPDLRLLIRDRKSVRKYTDDPLSQEELSYLLWATQGVRMEMPTGRHYRTVPSAGSRHSFETYLVIRQVTGLEPGVYRYLPFDHQLVFLFTAEDLAGTMTANASQQPFVGNCAACFIWTSIPYRMEWRYGFHSERVILMDVGHVCQNLYLAAGSIGCGTCGVAAYDQPALDKFLGLDGKDEFVVYLAPVGRLPAAAED